MKQIYRLVALGVLALCFTAVAYGQTTQSFECSSISVGSASTPVAVMGSSWLSACITERSGGANIYCWPYYTSTTPTSVPAACSSPGSGFTFGNGCVEVSPTRPFCVGGIGYGVNHSQTWIACALETGGSAVTVDACSGF